MPQTSLYMDDATMELIREKSAEAGISLSRYVSNAIKEHVERLDTTWPKGYWEAAYGCLSDEDAACFFNEGESAIDSSLDDSCGWFKEA